METQANIEHHQAARGLLPAGVRWAVLGATTLLLLSALYLIAVRGPALLLDMSALSQRLFCF